MSACREPRPLEVQQMHRVPMLVSHIHRFRIVRHARPGAHCPKLRKVPGLNNLIRSVEDAAQLLNVLLPFFVTERCFMPLPLACERRLVAVVPGFQSSRLTPIDRVPRDERNDTRNSSGDDRTGLTRLRRPWIPAASAPASAPPATAPLVPPLRSRATPAFAQPSIPTPLTVCSRRRSFPVAGFAARVRGGELAVVRYRIRLTQGSSVRRGEARTMRAGISLAARRPPEAPPHNPRVRVRAPRVPRGGVNRRPSAFTVAPVGRAIAQSVAAARGRSMYHSVNSVQRIEPSKRMTKQL
jgi:hypothetical protein